MAIVHQIAQILAPGQEVRWTVWGFPLNWFVTWDVTPVSHPSFLFPGTREVALNMEVTRGTFIAPQFHKEYRFTLSRRDDLPFPIVAHVYFQFEEFPVAWTFPTAAP